MDTTSKLTQLQRYMPSMVDIGIAGVKPSSSGEYVKLEDVVHLLQQANTSQLATEAQLLQVATLTQQQVCAIVCETNTQWKDANAVDLMQIVAQVSTKPADKD